MTGFDYAVIGIVGISLLFGPGAGDGGGEAEEEDEEAAEGVWHAEAEGRGVPHSGQRVYWPRRS